MTVSVCPSACLPSHCAKADQKAIYFTFPPIAQWDSPIHLCFHLFIVFLPTKGFRIKWSPIGLYWGQNSFLAELNWLRDQKNSSLKAKTRYSRTRFQRKFLTKDVKRKRTRLNTVNDCSSGPKSNEFRTLADYHPWSRLFLFTSFVTNFRWKRVLL